MKDRLIYLLVAGVVGVIFFIFGPGTQGAEYLNVEGSGFTRLPVDARALGMGGAFVAVADSYSASYYNPAGLIYLPSRQLGSMYTDLYGMGLISHSFLCFAEPDKGLGSGALSWSHLLANLEPEEWILDIITYSYANYLFNKESYPLNSWGFNLKYITQTTPYEDASGYSLDLSYLRKDTKLSWGVCVQDLFSRIDWGTGHTDNLPVNMMAGLAFNFNESSLLSLQIDIKPSGDILKNIRLGGEWKLGRNIFLRGGAVYKFQKGENLNFSAGIGLKANAYTKLKFSLDYAFLSSSQLSETHYFSLSFDF